MSGQSYLDFEQLEAQDPKRFQTRDPYPWLNEPGLLSETGFQALVDSLPPVDQFEKRFGHQRKFGQASHDRYALEYSGDLELPKPWSDFIAELQGQRYLGWLGTMLGTKHFRLSFHWHYTPKGCSVSPHCDARRKLGSHIFYLNTPDEWDASWGGETCILDDGGKRFDRRSSPAFEDFVSSQGSNAIGNWSLLFCRKGNSWHGVREIRCPGDELRKVFIVVINRFTPVDRLRERFGRPRSGNTL
jgi:hypothetical protein